MPIRIPNDLPALEILRNENVFVMPEDRAFHQDIRPLRILVLNLMPTKVTTETQLIRLLGNSPLQVDMTFLNLRSHKSKNTPREHMIRFYNYFDEICDQKFDGMIITGAPVEHMNFEEVNYWDELCEIMEWSSRHVHSTLYICWAAQAGLYYHYGVDKRPLDKKKFGIFEHYITKPNTKLLSGFDDIFYAPHSRNTEIVREDIEKVKELEILSESDEAGIYIVSNKTGRHIFVTGHPEYDSYTLKMEYERDVAKGIDIDVPVNYFPDDNPEEEPIVKWRGHANLLYLNWLNYYVYQETPYNLDLL